jgi:hypothetical protein
VSVCVQSLAELHWGKFRSHRFRETVARALWGSKFEECMPGGPFADKLDVALFVRVPAV